MYSTVVPVWAAAFILSQACWGAGSFLVASRRPVVGMLCGWCCFLFLCSIAWILGLSAHAMRPVFWLFFAAGFAALVRGRRWPELLCAFVFSGAVTLLLCAPFYVYDGMLAYGAHGTDMWGYVGAADWLYHHSTRDLPVIGQDAMRFNWSWYVLTIQDRPLIYQSLACLGSTTGLTAIQAYFAYPIVLFASIGMALAREPRLFRLPHWGLALIPALLLVFHPSIVLPWIAGFAGSAVAGLFCCLAFAAFVIAEEGPARTEAVALTMLMMFFCGGLYSGQFLQVGLVVAGIPALWGGLRFIRQHGWRRLRQARPGRLTAAVLAAAVVMALAVLWYARDEFEVGPPPPVWTERFVAEFLGVFGGTSPYAWLEYRAMDPIDHLPRENPVGLVALAGLLILFIQLSWQRWRENRDIRLPLIVGVGLGCLWKVNNDIHMMAKAMPAFGVSLLVVLAVGSTQLRGWVLGLAALIICCMPSVRSAAELDEMIHYPYITQTEANMTKLGEGDIWRVMAYLYFEEDTLGYNWAKHPPEYSGLTCFLPEEYRKQLDRKYHIPPPAPAK